MSAHLCRQAVAIGDGHIDTVSPQARTVTISSSRVVYRGDITYIPTDEGWLYLAAVLELHSRQVVGWSMQPHMQTSLVKGFWGHLKVACVLGQRFATREQAKAAILDWRAFYNHARLHSVLGYLSPMQYEQLWLAVQRKNAA